MAVPVVLMTVSRYVLLTMDQRLAFNSQSGQIIYVSGLWWQNQNMC